MASRFSLVSESFAMAAWCLRLVISAGLLACAALARRGPQKTSVYYIDFEHMNVTYWNPHFYRSISIIARRHGRHDPIHYVQADIEILVPFGNNLMVDLVVHEFLSNEYRPSFLEAHYRLCDVFHQDKKFWRYVEKFLVNKKCPWPIGVHHFSNISFSDVPLLKTFPFTKGRLFLKGYVWKTKESVAEAYVDVAIKQRWI